MSGFYYILIIAYLSANMSSHVNYDLHYLQIGRCDVVGALHAWLGWQTNTRQFHWRTTRHTEVIHSNIKTVKEVMLANPTLAIGGFIT